MKRNALSVSGLSETSTALAFAWSAMCVGVISFMCLSYRYLYEEATEGNEAQTSEATHWRGGYIGGCFVFLSRGKAGTSLEALDTAGNVSHTDQYIGGAFGPVSIR